jgi:hypothetical protein
VGVLFLHRNQQTIGKQYKGNRNQGLPTETQKCNSARQKTTIKPVLRSIRINLRLKKILQGGLRNSLTAVPSQSRNGFFISSHLAVFLQLHPKNMKKWCFIMFFLLFFSAFPAAVSAQCSICTKTTQQLGEKPAKSFNGGIIYLALFPFMIVGYIGYRWYKNNQDN